MGFSRQEYWSGLPNHSTTVQCGAQHHSSKASILWCSAFITVQLSQPYMTTGKITGYSPLKLGMPKLRSSFFPSNQLLFSTFPSWLKPWNLLPSSGPSSPRHSASSHSLLSQVGITLQRRIWKGPEMTDRQQTHSGVREFFQSDKTM